jgi:hypothetical protein
MTLTEGSRSTVSPVGTVSPAARYATCAATAPRTKPIVIHPILGKVVGGVASGCSVMRVPETDDGQGNSYSN